MLGLGGGGDWLAAAGRDGSHLVNTVSDRCCHMGKFETLLIILAEN